MPPASQQSEVQRGGKRRSLDLELEAELVLRPGIGQRECVDQLTRWSDRDLQTGTCRKQIGNGTGECRQSHPQIERREVQGYIRFDDVLHKKWLIAKAPVPFANGFDFTAECVNQIATLHERVLARGTIEKTQPDSFE